MFLQVHGDIVGFQQFEGREFFLRDFAFAGRRGQGKVTQGQSLGLQLQVRSLPTARQLAFEQAIGLGH